MSPASAKSAGRLELVGTSRRDVLARVERAEPLRRCVRRGRLGEPSLPGLTITTPESSFVGGFAVLTNGDFLVNDYDGADGNPVYREYYGFNAPTGKTPGTLVQGGLQIDLSVFGFSFPTGVTMSPDGNSLYFVTGIGTKYQTLVQTDLSGNLLGTQPININSIENIAVVPK
jgi:hypothetical protein